MLLIKQYCSVTDTIVNVDIVWKLNYPKNTTDNNVEMFQAKNVLRIMFTNYDCGQIWVIFAILFLINKNCSTIIQFLCKNNNFSWSRKNTILLFYEKNSHIILSAWQKNCNFFL